MANGFQGPPAVDFYSQLSGLGDVIAANRQAQAKRDAFAQATTPGADGKIDYGRAVLGLAQVDPQAAALLAQRQNHEDTLKQQERDFAFRQTEAARSQKNADRTFNASQDSTPDNFVADPSVPGGYRPIGPADPDYIAKVAKAKAEAEASTPGGGGLSLNPIYAKDASGNTVILQPGKNGKAVQSSLPEGVTLNGMDNETIVADAKRLNAGDDTILKKYDKKGQGRVDLLRLNNEANRLRTEAGQDPIDLTQNVITLQGDKARERAAGTMEGRMAPAAIEAQGAFKIAQNSLDNLWRTNSVPLNKLLQMGEEASSNPELKAAKVAVNTAAMTYSRAIAPTGVGTVDSQQHAREILNTADGPKATAAAFAQLAREVDMAHASPGIAREYFAASRKARMEGKPPPAMPEYQPAQPVRAAPPPEAVAALKKDPRRAADFDAYYGAGSSDAVLGRR